MDTQLPVKNETSRVPQIYDKELLLQKSKNFCMLPWVHLHIWPDSKVFPCCLSDSLDPLSTYRGSLSEAWNSENMRQLRKNMVNDKPTPRCRRCYELEGVGASSLRQSANRSFGKHFDAVDTTQKDGTVEKIQMRYLDVRFSSLCNFKCRSCGPDLSNAWVDDHNAIYGDEARLPWKTLRVGAELWDELQPLLGQVESAYFAGGEPIICDELYKVLDHWLQIGHVNLELGYTTNFSLLKFKNKNILDYWRQFPRTRISASLDDSGPRAEYLRKGTNWNSIVENRRKMLRECPDVYFEITPTIGIYNVWHFPVFHREWIDQGLLELDNIRVNILTKPDNLAINILPASVREELVLIWEKALEELVQLAAVKNINIRNIREGYGSVINMLKNEGKSETIESFWLYSNTLDLLRKENIFEVFPEFEAIRDSYIYGYLGVRRRLKEPSSIGDDYASSIDL
jgi:sulfatase maturation enzyme AslB (radical SAM superfamily)